MEADPLQTMTLDPVPNNPLKVRSKGNDRQEVKTPNTADAPMSVRMQNVT